jgi:hypothetical protein
MKGMKSVAEFQQAPPAGRYWSIIGQAVAEFTKKDGASMIHLTLAIDDSRFPQYKDISTEDYIITDGAAKGGGMGKTKLRGLGIDVDSSDQEISDEVLCAQLAGKGVWVDYVQEQRMGRSTENGPFDQPMTVVDSRTGQTVKLMRLTVKGYATHNVGAAQVAAPVAQPVNTAPQGAPYAQQPQQTQQFAQPPAQFQQQAPQGFAPTAGFAPPPQPGQPQYAQQGNLQPAFQQPPTQGLPPGMQQAAPPWAQQGAPQGAPVAQPNGATPDKKPRRVKVQDVDAQGNPIPG